MNPRSITFQLTAWYAALLTAAFLLLGVFLFFGMRHHLHRSLADSQTKRARVIADTLVARVPETGEAALPQEISDRYAPEINSRFIRISHRDRGVLYTSAAPRDASFDPLLITPLPQPLGKAFTRIERPADGNDLLIVTVPYPAVGTPAYAVEAGAPLAPAKAVMRDWLFTLALAFPVVILGAVGGGWFLARRAFAPVERIIRSAEQITLRNLATRLPVARTGDELERLSAALNHMISRLDVAFQHNRRFMADASHELRTPLTIMRGELESILSQSPPAPDLPERLASVLEEVERLAKIVETLFALSRLDAGEAQAESVRFDLAQLVTSTAEQMCLLAEDKHITVTCRADGEVPVEGDRARLKQVVVNLLDNAIKYTPANGRINLRTSIHDGRALLEIEDTGIGIPADALPRVFERFFRVDKARARAMGGAGIGLSIVKAICAAHGGQVAVASVEGQGTRFKVTLPLAPAATRKESSHAAQ